MSGEDDEKQPRRLRAAGEQVAIQAAGTVAGGVILAGLAALVGVITLETLPSILLAVGMIGVLIVIGFEAIELWRAREAKPKAQNAEPSIEEVMDEVRDLAGQLKVFAEGQMVQIDLEEQSEDPAGPRPPPRQDAVEDDDDN